MYDEEAVIQDDDIEMAILEEEARYRQALEAKGICLHGRVIGIPESGQISHPEQVGLKRGQVRCTAGCGRVFNSDEEWYEALDDY